MYVFLKWLLLLAALVLFQTSILPHYLLYAFKPDLLLILMVYLALRAPVSASLPAAYGLGVLSDCLGGVYLGLNGFSFLAAYLILKSMSDRLYVQSSLLFVLTVSAATLGIMFSNLLLLILFSQASGVYSSLISSIIPHILANAFVASLVAALPSFGRPWGVK